MEKTLKSLHEIVKRNLSFQDYARQLKNDISYTDEEKRKIRMLVNQVINFYFRYENIVNYDEEEPFSLHAIILLAMYSVNRRRNFVSFSYDDMLSLAAGDMERIQAKYVENDFPLRIPEAMSREDKTRAISTRFSVPVFLVERLRDDIGRRNIVRFFANRYEERYGIVNEKLTEVAAFYDKHPAFEYDPINETFHFKERGFLKDTVPYRDGLIIVSSHSVLDMYDRIILLNPKKVLFNLFDGTNLLLLFAFLNPDLQIIANVPSIKARRILEHLIKKFELQNVRTKAPYDEKFDLVVVSLTNSSLNGNVRYRDLYLTLDEDFTKYVDRAAKELNQSVKNVSEDGHLLMLTNTVIRDETHYQVLNFLKAHEEFTLVREKQHFHFNKGHESLYYAIMKRQEVAEVIVKPEEDVLPEGEPKVDEPAVQPEVQLEEKETPVEPKAEVDTKAMPVEQEAKPEVKPGEENKVEQKEQLEEPTQEKLEAELGEELES